MKSLVLNLAIPYCREPLRYIAQPQVKGTNAEKDALLRAMLREAEAWDGELEGYEVRAVRLSGGAATVMSPDLLGNLLLAVRSHFPMRQGCEVSFDALPGTIGTASLSGISAGRPNRAELFLRSVSDRELKVIDAPFKVDDGRIAMRFMAKFRLNNVGITVHFGIPGQTTATCLATVRDLIVQRPHHIRLLPLSDAAIDGAPDLASQREMFLQAADTLVQAGYIHYMAGYFCMPNHEWLYPTLREQGCEVVSLGPGGVTILEGYATRNTNNIKLYLRDAGDFEKQTAEAFGLSPAELLSHALRGRLGQAVGCRADELERQFGAPLSEADRHTIDGLIETGTICLEDGCLKPTREGLFSLVSNREM